jgi:alpha-galactosidase/6-phospho-beta-glucosidase family protein
MLKIAVIGAGSYTFGPSVLNQAILENRLSGVELALVDVDRETLELMAGVGRRMARETGVDVTITTHTERPSAFEGAEFVICSAAREMQRRFTMDYEIIQQYMPGHQITEFGGIAGISNSLRQIELISQICADMKRHCPDAWLLNVANPLPRICQAAYEEDIRTVGFCSVGMVAYHYLSQLFYGQGATYPFDEPRKRWSMTTAGLNHFTWILELRDQETGEDLLPELRERIEQGATSGNPQVEAVFRETGYFLAPGDDHVRDFLPPHPSYEPVTHLWHGTVEERKTRLQRLKAIGEGKIGWDDLFTNPSWERPLDFIAAYKYGKPTYFPALNLINAGQISDLPREVFVETPVTVEDGLMKPKVINLPDSVLQTTQHTALVTETIVRAGLTRSRQLVHHAVELDPTIVDKAAGIQAIDACLNAHADLLPTFR